jgi:hypothetical protein
MFFANEQRDKVREENPGIKFGKFALSANLQIPVLTVRRRGRQDAW